MRKEERKREEGEPQAVQLGRPLSLPSRCSLIALQFSNTWSSVSCLFSLLLAVDADVNSSVLFQLIAIQLKLSQPVFLLAQQRRRIEIVSSSIELIVLISSSFLYYYLKKKKAVGNNNTLRRESRQQKCVVPNSEYTMDRPDCENGNKARVCYPFRSKSSRS